MVKERENFFYFVLGHACSEYYRWKSGTDIVWIPSRCVTGIPTRVPCNVSDYCSQFPLLIVIFRWIPFLPIFSHNLLDAKINYVLAHCHDHIILSAVQSIIQNMVCSSSEVAQQQLPYLQSKLFWMLLKYFISKFSA